jgi:hypothetical protein
VNKAERIAGLERIKHLEEQLARIPIDSDRYRQCALAIRIAVSIYRETSGSGRSSDQVHAAPN